MKKRRFLKISAMMMAVLVLSLMIGTWMPAGWAATASAEAYTPVYSASELFTSRDLQQTADLTDAAVYNVTGDIHIDKAGVYVLSGTASNATVYVEAPKDAKVQLVLDGLSITNTDFPCIYVVSADKVFITTSSDSSLSVTRAFRYDGDIHTDGVIFSRDDLTLNGTARLTIRSLDAGVVSKDDLKITGGAYTVSAATKAFEANDSIRVCGGTFELTAGTDGLHAENNDDDSSGYIYLDGGTMNINAGDDGIHATSVLQIDGGEYSIRAREGLEGTYIQINDGTLDISATDDGINAAQKSRSFQVDLELNGGSVTVSMSGGDTDGIDSNGNLHVNGGVVNVSGSSTFDYDGIGNYTGGTIIANGQTLNGLPNQMMGGRGGRGGMNGFGQQNGYGRTNGYGGRGGWH